MTRSLVKAWSPIVLLSTIALAGCQRQKVPAPESAISFATYEDCILQKVSKSQTKAAAEAVINACSTKFIEADATAAAAATMTPQALLDALIAAQRLVMKRQLG